HPRDLVRLVLVDDFQAEDLLVEVDRALQVARLDADVVDPCRLERRSLRRGRRRGARGRERRETLNEVPARQSAGLAARAEIRDYGVHRSAGEWWWWRYA